VITNDEGARKLAPIRDRLPDLEFVLSIDGASAIALSFHDVCDVQNADYHPKLTRADDPAILIYTSGTTGNPKGALHAHRVLLGHLPGVEISHNFLPNPGDVLWTPADWAWIGGMLDVLMPALHHGIPIVACRFTKFHAETTFELIKSYGIKNVFLPPTALKIMRQFPGATGYRLKLRSVASGGETLGKELIKWGEEALGTTINEFYGQTECNMVVSCCSVLERPLPGSMGRAVPGHVVEIISPETGAILDPDTEGTIGVKAPDPVMFLGYWNNEEATAKKFIDGPSGRWLLTGDRGTRDAHGRIHFLGRDDDVINSAGYRIGPAEIEDCLITHKAVRMAGVVGKPDKLRGTVVSAFVTLNDGFTASEALAEEIAEYVKARLAAYEYPRVVRFIQDMPMTTTGKIIRAELRKLADEEAAWEEAASDG
jgi:acetyl-CoA synthetase